MKVSEVLYQPFADGHVWVVTATRGVVHTPGYKGIARFFNTRPTPRQVRKFKREARNKLGVNHG